MSKKLRINGIIEESVVDGPGIRYVIFAQGCPHNCEGCHNPQTHSFTGGYEADAEDMFYRITENPIITGVTFSGGEPMCQADALCVLAGKIKSAGLELAVYTGYTFERLLDENNSGCLKLLSLCDILIDGPYQTDKKSMDLPFKGSKNQRILDVKKSLELKSPIPVTDLSWR
jgi:anaerobic ribonucleoside-triphosphate reductase activating protein